jgi:serine/threonine-protein kinase RsbT
MDEHAVLVRIEADTDIVAARQVGREKAEQIGFTATDATLIATAISEVARNITTYAGSGEIEIVTRRNAVGIGIEVIARDHGPGISDIEQAMLDGFSTAGGMGLGLPGARRLMDEFAVVAPVGVGTVVTMRKWVRRAG